MSYPTIYALDQLWKLFEEKAKNIPSLNSNYLSDIKKLMTAESVIDLSMHEIYLHAEYVHELTEKLIYLKNVYPSNYDVNDCYQRWFDVLKVRNQIPLKIKHDKSLDGECDFRFSLQLMMGNPHGFKQIQVLDAKNRVELKEAVKSIHRLDCLAEGVSFAGLPIMHDKVLSTIMEYKDVTCLLAKDQSNQIIGYCWGILLRDVAVSPTQKANIFWVMDMVRDPDFYDKPIKVGELLRAKMVDMIKSKNDCNFVGFTHILNHKFHTAIISSVQGNEERIRYNNEEFSGKTSIKNDDSLGLFRTHFIRADKNNYPYPNDESIKPAVYKALWKAAHSAKDFILGGISFFARTQYQKLTHHVLNNPIDNRLIEHAANEQQVLLQSRQGFKA